MLVKPIMVSPILSWKEFVKPDKNLVSLGYALAIELGAIRDVGLIMETMGGNETVVGGTWPQRMASCLSALDLFLHHREPILASMVLADKRKSRSGRSTQVSLIDTVANILGVKDTKNIDKSATLAYLGNGHGLQNKTMLFNK